MIVDGNLILLLTAKGKGSAGFAKEPTRAVLGSWDFGL